MKAELSHEKPEQLRPIVHGQIDRLNADELPLVHYVLLQLQTERLGEEIADGLAKENSFFDRIDETIAEFRKKRPYGEKAALHAALQI
jgi:hypothetical protein